jgi:hypothetical protein
MDKFLINTLIDGSTNNINIGHFFHEYLFNAILAYIRNNNIIWVLSNNLREWELKFCLLMIKYLNIKYEYSDLGDYRIKLNTFNIKQHREFEYIMNLINKIINTEYHYIQYSDNYKVLYFRNDATRRKMIGYNGELNDYFNEIIYDMSNLSFENQVQLFMKCSHFVTIEGAHLTNVIFMNKNAKILDITPTNNSWQLMFGTSKCVKIFEQLNLNLPDFNDNIQYNNFIETKIKDFLKI